MPELEPELRSSPYFAGLSGKTDAERDELERRIDALPRQLKEILFSEDTDQRLRAAMQQAGVPDTFTVALAKIIFLGVLGDIPLTDFNGLLGKIGLDATQSAAMSTALADILSPVAVDRAAVAVPASMPKVPPLTVQRPATIGSNTPPRNIIDLRKPPETT